MKIIAKKYSYNNYKDNERTVCSLKEIEKRKIVEHNDLITSVAKMDKTPLKIFELAVSCIDTENLPKDNTIYLSKKELFTFFDVSDNGKHTRFKEAIKVMQKEAFFEIREEDKYITRMCVLVLSSRSCYHNSRVPSQFQV